MKEIQRLLMNTINSHYNFNIVEYRDEENNGIWGLVRNDNSYNEIIVFIEREHLRNGIREIYNYTRNNYGEKDSKVHVILIDSNNYLSEIITSVDHPYSINNVSFNFILIDDESGKVVFYDEEAYNIASLIHNILYSSTSIKEKKSNKEIVNITNILIVANIIAFLFTAYLSKNIFDINSKVLLIFGAKQNDFINRGEYYRLFTAMFLHGGLMHIAFNMYALRSLGPFIERIYGKLKFLAIYFLGGLTSSFFSYMFSDGMSVGASGAIFALLGCALVYGIEMKNKIGKDFMSNILQVIGINLILGFTVSNIDNYGHIGGLLGGIVVSFILSKFYKK